MTNLLALLSAIEAQLPRNQAELYIAELISMIGCGCIAFLMGLIHHAKFDLYRILRNGLGGGATLPPSLLLILYPLSQHARDLFGTEALKGYLMIAGATGVVLSLYGLFKK